MKALVFERSLPPLRGGRRSRACCAPGAGARVGPLSLDEIDEPALPGRRLAPGAAAAGRHLRHPTWPRSTARSSRYFEPIVSFPFVPGHEVVGDLDDGTRVVVEPVLALRGACGIDPPCAAVRRAATPTAASASRSATSSPGCRPASAPTPAAAGARRSSPTRASCTACPTRMSDEAAVMVEPAACAVHGALRAGARRATPSSSSAPARSACCTIAALRRHALPGRAHRRRQAPRAAPAGRASSAPTSSSSPTSCAAPCGAPRRVDGARRPGSPAAPTSSSTASAARPRSPGARVVAPRRHASCSSACPGASASTSRRCGNGRSCSSAPTPTARATSTAGARSTSPSSSCRRRPRRLVSAVYPLDRYREAIDHAANAGRRGAVKIAFDLRDERERTLMPRRPGFVLEVDRSTPPTLFYHGEGFRLEQLPVGSRVIYPAEPLDAARGPRRRHPRRAAPPARRQRAAARAAAPGMKLTIAFDDVSLPLPPMRAPDVRQRVIEAVLDMAAEAGVDDVVLIAALALHRRMHEHELRHALGDRVYDAFEPHGLLWQHDAEDPDNLVHLGHDRPGRGRRDQPAGGRERPARLRQHQPRRHGRRPQERGHRPGVVPSRCATTTTCARCSTAARSWTRSTPSCTRRTGAWAGSSRRRA